MTGTRWQRKTSWPIGATVEFTELFGGATWNRRTTYHAKTVDQGPVNTITNGAIGGGLK